MTAEASSVDALPLALVTLLRGVAYRNADQALWQSLLSTQSRIREHVAILGLDFVLDEAEGFAYLRQSQTSLEGGIPRLVARRQLGFAVSLLLALLRKKLAEFDATSSDTRLVLSRADIVETMRLFLSDTVNEVRLMDRIDRYVARVVELGFLRRLPHDQFEVMRILKAFVDGQWLADFNDRLVEYRGHAQRDVSRDDSE